MSKTNDGGQAFPSHPILYSSADAHLAQGMSLRAYFVGQALPSVISAPLPKGMSNADRRDLVAKTCCLIADALIAELAKDTTS